MVSERKFIDRIRDTNKKKICIRKVFFIFFFLHYTNCDTESFSFAWMHTGAGKYSFLKIYRYIFQSDIDPSYQNSLMSHKNNCLISILKLKSQTYIVYHHSA